MRFVVRFNFAGVIQNGRDKQRENLPIRKRKRLADGEHNVDHQKPNPDFQALREGCQPH